MAPSVDFKRRGGLVLADARHRIRAGDVLFLVNRLWCNKYSPQRHGGTELLLRMSVDVDEGGGDGRLEVMPDRVVVDAKDAEAQRTQRKAFWRGEAEIPAYAMVA